jgi:PhoH-like ATPase
MSDKKIYILDTNVLLHDPQCIYSFQDNDIVIPMMVLEELDNIKDRKDKYLVTKEARLAIKNIEKCINDASPEEIEKGVKLQSGGNISVYSASLFDSNKKLKDHRSDDKINNDNVIINDTRSIQEKYPDKIVCLVTKDINMRLKAKATGIKHVEDYKKDQILSDIDYLPSGVKFLKDLSSNIEDVKQVKHKNNHYLIKKEDLLFYYPDLKLYYNLFLVDEKQDFIVKIIDVGDNSEDIVCEFFNSSSIKAGSPKKFKPKDVEQSIAMNTLMDKDSLFNILVGPAGTGKTYLAIMAALEMIDNKGHYGYDKIILSRSIADLEENIGFLPGTEEEKMLPWLGGFVDNIEDILKYEGNEDTHTRKNIQDSAVEQLIRMYNIQYKSLNYIRGRSFVNTLVIIDEIQGLTPFQMKTLITRMGKGSKLICLGNLKQIDSPYITELTSGLTHAAERFKNYPHSTIVHLNNIERSSLAAYAEENL